MQRQIASDMAHPNCDERRATVGKVLAAGISIGPREAKLLGVVFNCSGSAIQADAKLAARRNVASHVNKKPPRCDA
jgi:hypothetical protein